MKKFAFLLTIVLATPSAQIVHAADAIVVASKIDTEGALLGNMIIALLRHRGYAVENRLQLGPTKIVRTAILAGQIDIYPEYTGNGAFFFHREADPLWKDAQRGYEEVRALDLSQNRLVWLKPAPVSNTWAIAVNHDLARAGNLHTLVDFSHFVRAGGAVKLAASAEFVDSPSALPAFQQAYAFNLREDQLLVLAGGNTAATMRIAAEHISDVNAAMAYATDGAFKTLGLVLLDDDKHAQTVYAPCGVVRQVVLERNPEISAIIDAAFASLSLDTLQALNAKISVDGEDAAKVATTYLFERGLLQ